MAEVDIGSPRQYAASAHWRSTALPPLRDDPSTFKLKRRHVNGNIDPMIT
ncbi:hypothetical protein KFU94_26910 [Chloroflexi bacterium TSY]|nr:hypothetical protein [Chloroflexi bacterium TSY]